MQSWPAVEVPQLPAGPRRDLRLHDSASGARVALAGRGPARLYVCGITPYDATHLGHAATYLAFDVLVRVWRDAGRDVHYVQNVTDIDEPLLERAARDGVDWRVLAEQQTELFRTDMTALRVLPPTDLVGAVEAMGEIAAAALELQEAGAAYLLDGDLYLSVAAAPHFGAVAHLSRERMLALFAERGGDPGRPGKRDQLDSLLWRAERPGEPAWDSPLGRGRPGWHIECAAISRTRLGPVVDVQGGGSDLAFPHHEHSVACTEALTGQWPLVGATVHTAMIALDGRKMSKSLGNLELVSRLRAQGVEPAAIRLALLAGHYRTDREWTPALLAEAAARLARWRAAVSRPAGQDAAPVLEQVRAALADDLDTPAALASVDGWAADRVVGEVAGDVAAPATLRQLVDALLGVAL